MRFRGPLDTPSRLYTGRVGVSCLISFYCPHDILSYIFSFLLTFLNYVIVYHRRFFLYYIILYYIILYYIILPNCLEGGLWSYRAVTFPVPALSAEWCDWAERKEFASSDMAALLGGISFWESAVDLDTHPTGAQPVPPPQFRNRTVD